MNIDNIIFDKKDIEHQDERRVLACAFNGDFEAEHISALASTTGTAFRYRGNSMSYLFYIFSGSANISAGEKEYALVQVGNQRDRLFIPAGVDHVVKIDKKSTLVVASCSNSSDDDFAISGTYGDLTRVGVIKNLFNKSWAGFAAKQLKFLIPFDQEVILGGHYHDYQEAYSMLRGECTFRLEDVAGPSKREEVRLSAQEGNHLVIEPKQAHVARAGARSILIGYTAEAFEGAGSATPYKNDWLLFKE